MVEKTLVDALTIYKIHIQMGNNMNIVEVNRIIRNIDLCEKYLSEGNRITDAWMKDNYSVLSKAVKCAYDLYQRNKGVGFDDKIKDESVDLNKCMTYYRLFYKELGFDFEDIHY